MGVYARGAEAGSGVEAERQMSNEPFIVFVGTETQLPWLRAYDDIMIDLELVSLLATHGRDGRPVKAQRFFKNSGPRALHFSLPQRAALRPRIRCFGPLI